MDDHVCYFLMMCGFEETNTAKFDLVTLAHGLPHLLDKNQGTKGRQKQLRSQYRRSTLNLHTRSEKPVDSEQEQLPSPWVNARR